MGLGPSFVVSFTAPTVGKVRKFVIVHFSKIEHRKVSLKNITPKENSENSIVFQSLFLRWVCATFFFNKSQVDALKYISWKEVIPRKAVLQLLVPARGGMFFAFGGCTPLENNMEKFRKIVLPLGSCMVFLSHPLKIRQGFIFPQLHVQPLCSLAGIESCQILWKNKGAMVQEKGRHYLG